METPSPQIREKSGSSMSEDRIVRKKEGLRKEASTMRGKYE